MDGSQSSGLTQLNTRSRHLQSLRARGYHRALTDACYGSPGCFGAESLQWNFSAQPKARNRKF
eukprot:3035304-Alexandrium_andersonii.AAC.1